MGQELSNTEQKLYDYIKEKEEVSFDDIKKDLGENFLGASGRLIQRELVEKGKREHSTGYVGYGIKYVKTLKIKKGE